MMQDQNQTGSTQAGRDFLGEEVDLGLGRNAPYEDIYGKNARLGGAGVLFLLALILSAGAGGLYYLAYQRGLEEGQKNLPPVVLADPTPIKTMPEGAEEEAENLNIYNVMQGRANERGNGDVESLVADRKTPFDRLEEPRASAERGGEKPKVAAVPDGNSIVVLPREQQIKRAPPRPDLNRAPRVADNNRDAVRPTSDEHYMVQLAAARSRALARGIYSNLQQSHAALLSDRDPLILRVDLGASGVYYRVNVPNFSRRNLALAFCANLKRQGQDCLVKKQP